MKMAIEKLRINYKTQK